MHETAIFFLEWHVDREGQKPNINDFWKAKLFESWIFKLVNIVFSKENFVKWW